MGGAEGHIAHIANQKSFSYVSLNFCWFLIAMFARPDDQHLDIP
jgi:hypothetical protein